MIRAGTSGFSYPGWKGAFYPSDLPQAQMLSYYAARLPAVEVNSTFYRRPPATQLESWAADVPSTFRFAFKASRYFSAGPGLKNAEKPLADFITLVSNVKTNLGPLLVQLPKHIKKDVTLLADFVAVVPQNTRVALDLVDPSWSCEEVHEVLRARDVAWCVTESDGAEADFVTTASWGYVRLRKARYDARSIRVWAERLLSAPWGDAYVFFKHDKTGPKYAAALMKAATSPNPGAR